MDVRVADYQDYKLAVKAIKKLHRGASKPTEIYLEDLLKLLEDALGDLEQYSVDHDDRYNEEIHRIEKAIADIRGQEWADGEDYLYFMADL